MFLPLPVKVMLRIQGNSIVCIVCRFMIPDREKAIQTRMRLNRAHPLLRKYAYIQNEFASNTPEFIPSAFFFGNRLQQIKR
jgi:hypothetical protein